MAFGDSIEKVKSLSDKQVAMQLDTPLHNRLLEQEVRDYALSICYERSLCRSLGLDYVSLPSNDYHRALLTARYILDKDEQTQSDVQKSGRADLDHITSQNE